MSENSQNESVKFCPKCGIKLPPNVKKCSKCGFVFPDPKRVKPIAPHTGDAQQPQQGSEQPNTTVRHNAAQTGAAVQSNVAAMKNTQQQSAVTQQEVVVGSRPGRQNIFSKVLFVIGVIILVLGFLGSIVLGVTFDDGWGLGWIIFFACAFEVIIVGALILGAAEAIELLDENKRLLTTISRKMKG